ncbi:MAG: hypothetical protein AAFQ98_09365 [Bacteroidota bacterium]
MWSLFGNTTLMMAMRTTLLLLALGVGSLSSCEPPFLEPVSGLSSNQFVLIQDSGSPAADGCGWTFQSNDTTYSAADIPRKLKTSGIYVSGKLTRLSNFVACGFNVTPGLEEASLQVNVSNSTVLYFARSQCADPWDVSRPGAQPSIEAMLGYVYERDIRLVTAQALDIESPDPVCTACNCSALSYFEVRAVNEDVENLLALGFVEQDPGK